MSTFGVELVSPNIGAEITGLDLANPLDENTVAELKKIWLDRKVVFFRDQQLTPDQQVAFASQIAGIEKYPFLLGVDDNPLVAPVLKLPHETVNFGGVWHSDTAYLERPAAGAVLYALEIPPLGGDTIWANMGAAYEALPDAIKAQIRNLKAINSSAKAEVSKTREDRMKTAADDSAPEEFANVHPVVRTHPETSEKILYVNEGHTVCFDGWTEGESEPLLRTLYEYQRKPEFQCRFKWTVGSVAMWDNRSTQHYPINDYTGYKRLLHRVSLKGDKPV